MDGYAYEHTVRTYVKISKNSKIQTIQHKLGITQPIELLFNMKLKPKCSFFHYNLRRK